LGEPFVTCLICLDIDTLLNETEENTGVLYV
jgi:hypothetical protein